MSLFCRVALFSTTTFSAACRVGDPPMLFNRDDTVGESCSDRRDDPGDDDGRRINDLLDVSGRDEIIDEREKN